MRGKVNSGKIVNLVIFPGWDEDFQQKLPQIKKSVNFFYVVHISIMKSAKYL